MARLNQYQPIYNSFIFIHKNHFLSLKSLKLYHKNGKFCINLPLFISIFIVLIKRYQLLYQHYQDIWLFAKSKVSELFYFFTIPSNNLLTIGILFNISVIKGNIIIVPKIKII